MEKLLKKDVKFIWNEQCQEILNVLKDNMVSAPILVLPYWNKEFHVHDNALFVVLGIVLEQPGEGALDYPITFASRKLLTT